MAKFNYRGSSFGRGRDGSRGSGYVAIYLRFALGSAFLSAVADRFGLWGPAGTPLVAWGNFHNFLLYAAKLNPWFAHPWIPYVGWIATACEIIFGVALIIGFKTRTAAILSGCLLLAFAVGMMAGLGIKAPLNFSVFTGSAAAFVLATLNYFPCSVDAMSRTGSW